MILSILSHKKKPGSHRVSVSSAVQEALVWALARHSGAEAVEAEQVALDKAQAVRRRHEYEARPSPSPLAGDDCSKPVWLRGSVQAKRKPDGAGLASGILPLTKRNNSCYLRV